MEREPKGKLVPMTVLLTPEQVAWLRAASAQTGDSPDDIIREALQVLRRLSGYRNIRV